MAANKVTRVVTDYAIDRRNPAAGAVLDAITRLNGFLVRPVVGSDASAEYTFHGYTQPLQHFTGAAGANPITYRDGGYPEIGSAVTTGPMGDPTRRIFAARLRRGRA